MTVRRETALKAYLAAVWAVCLYRAITQSIVHDEALTYGLYIQAPFSEMFQSYSPNHHFLNTLLMKLSVAMFGVSEWSLRLPALGGAALYLAAVYRLGTRELKTAAACALGVGLLTLNPFLLDFLVAARGYGMALAFWMWAAAILLDFVRRPETAARRELLVAGLSLSLSIMANLVFAVPVFVLGFIVWLLLRGGRRTPAAPQPEPVSSKKRQRRRKRSDPSPPELALRAFWQWVVTPALCGCFLLFVISPVAKASSGDFYAGASSLGESLHSLYDGTLAHGGPLRRAAGTPAIRDAVSFGLAPLIFVAALALGYRRRNVLLVACAGTAVACGLLLIALNLSIHLLYPFDRTGIYFLALLGLAIAGLVDELPATSVIAVVLVACFLLQFDTRKFVVWEYDADTRAILVEIAKRVPDKRPDSVRLANSWQLEPSLSFYAMKQNLTWLQPITRAPVGPGADYYVLISNDQGAVDALHLRVIYAGPNSGTLLAIPSAAGPSPL